MRPQFSLKEITANKGDRVRININTTSGVHDFNIDELNVHTTTPRGKVTSVGFIANKYFAHQTTYFQATFQKTCSGIALRYQ